MINLRRYPTHLTFAIHLLVVFMAVAFHWKHDNWLSDYDRATQFLPWFSYIGERVRDFEVPAWNVHDGSGVPAIGSPAGGWLYLPVMVSFSLFEAENAYKMLVLLQSLIGGAATLALCRRVNLGHLATFTAATAFAVGPLLYSATMFSTPVSQIVSFFPVGILAAENAIRATGHSSRFGWSMLGAVAMVNMFAASPPRFMFGALTMVAWLGYRWLISRPHDVPDRHLVFLRALQFGTAMGVGTLLLGLSSFWPVYAFQEASNVAGADYTSLVGADYVQRLGSWQYIAKSFLEGNNPSLRVMLQGSAVLLTSGVAILLGRNRGELWFFAGLTWLFLDLSWRQSLSRPVLNLLPGFEQINSHRPNSTQMFVMFSLAMVCGAGIQVIQNNPRGRWVVMLKLIPLAVLLVLFDGIIRANYDLGWWQYSIAVIATIALLLPELTRLLKLERLIGTAPRTSAVMLIMLIFIYPFGHDVVDTIDDPTSAPEWVQPIGLDQIVSESMDTILSTTEIDPAGALLQAKYSDQNLFRYAPYTGSSDPIAGYNPAANRRMEPAIIAILANARATFLDLEQIPVYNPVHYQVYVDYIEVMNGAAQDYHYLDVMAPALGGSQLLDMLNVRYVLVPRAVTPQPPIAESGTIAYEDDLIVVYENPDAFPRAWIVHNVQPSMDGAELELLNSDQVDGRYTAFVDGDLPPVSLPANGPNSDVVTFNRHDPEFISVESNTGGDGLLVFSEVYDKGWNAYVNGEKVDLLRTNHALRGVPVPAGEHTVELKYEPIELRIGLWSTGIASLAMLAIWVWAGVDRFRHRPTVVPEVGP